MRTKQQTHATTTTRRFTRANAQSLASPEEFKAAPEPVAIQPETPSMAIENEIKKIIESSAVIEQKHAQQSQQKQDLENKIKGLQDNALYLTQQFREEKLALGEKIVDLEHACKAKDEKEKKVEQQFANQQQEYNTSLDKLVSSLNEKTKAFDEQAQKAAEEATKLVNEIARLRTLHENSLKAAQLADDKKAEEINKKNLIIKDKKTVIAQQQSLLEGKDLRLNTLQNQIDNLKAHITSLESQSRPEPAQTPPTTPIPNIPLLSLIRPVAQKPATTPVPVTSAPSSFFYSPLQLAHLQQQVHVSYIAVPTAPYDPNKRHRTQ